jgi:hypothetical protein
LPLVVGGGRQVNQPVIRGEQPLDEARAMTVVVVAVAASTKRARR